MNIFYLDTCPVQAAQMQGDVHVVKMALETAQLLSTAQRMLGNDSPKLYKMTHMHHPSAVWARESLSNYQWVYMHFMALCQEYTLRYGKQHLCWTKLGKVLAIPPAGMPRAATPVRLAMPDEYKQDCPVASYRAYYAGDKAWMLRYTNRARPSWLEV